ncbi:uncharacterized protein LOC115267711 [Aedes albopictus]|uniref:Uncharacterized protein n=1 Tax=Aedes albopictus TaxID=7160 RepID=A0ABM1YFC9_AEDAL|nr:uncharacterized protein LOC115267709 [Aedes albopictus]
MVFSNHSNAAFLPLDSDQGVTFYKNENLLFAPPPPVGAASPTALVCRRNTPVAAMLSTSTGSNPFSGQPLLHGPRQHHGNNVCDDFQPVAHLSSNGYYGYVPPANLMPTKVMSTVEQAAAVTPPVVNGNGVGILLDSIHPVTAAAATDDSYSMMMDCGGGGGGGAGIAQVENYHQQQQHLRKRKEYSDVVEANCKRRKTWLEQPHDAGFVNSPSWNQPSNNQMDCQDQPMDTFSSQQNQFQHQSPITMNASTTIAFNGFQHQNHHHLGQHLQQQQQSTLISTPPMPETPPQQHTILQPKNRLFHHASSPSPNMARLGSSEHPPTHQQLHHHRCPTFNGGANDCQQLEDLFISLHGSGFYLAC